MHSSHMHGPTPHTLTPWSLHLHHTPSQVYLGRYKGTSDFCTIKVLQKEAIVKCHKVKHIMAKRNDMTHPFLVDLHYSFQTSTNLYFVLDYVNGGALFFHLQREKVFNEPRARWVTSSYTIIKLCLGVLMQRGIIIVRVRVRVHVRACVHMSVCVAAIVQWMAFCRILEIEVYIYMDI